MRAYLSRVLGKIIQQYFLSVRIVNQYSIHTFLILPYLQHHFVGQSIFIILPEIGPPFTLLINGIMRFAGAWFNFNFEHCLAIDKMLSGSKVDYGLRIDSCRCLHHVVFLLGAHPGPEYSGSFTPMSKLPRRYWQKPPGIGQSFLSR